MSEADFVRQISAAVQDARRSHREKLRVDGSLAGSSFERGLCCGKTMAFMSTARRLKLERQMQRIRRAAA